MAIEETQQNKTEMQSFKSLYNGIMNDYSIRRYSTGWQDIVTKIEKRYNKIPKTDEQFTFKLLFNALTFAKGSLRKKIECFAKELSINTETLREKQDEEYLKNIGNHRSPFGIGS